MKQMQVNESVRKKHRIPPSPKNNKTIITNKPTNYNKLKTKHTSLPKQSPKNKRKENKAKQKTNKQQKKKKKKKNNHHLTNQPPSPLHLIRGTLPLPLCLSRPSPLPVSPCLSLSLPLARSHFSSKKTNAK